ncbi:hypothetical protein D5039_18065 [Verminephrobacter aporrectodeae subsp. tuberculatae]|uniref:Adhesin domain-containing protein n=1 Tax=Verminephrobacter aporrectodeae subsp. tuberculatae TaxID=1110392 RepID=A0ABT3KXB5_9BURK|nr:hypothetical protein [Verminephrobacter aporrectodeae]MCW5322977.1 hypothetical protein [Verminephrobacter aporrectodeae subsp. tuberculatae]
MIARGPRRRGAWLFAGIVALFCALLAASGREYFEGAPREHNYLLRAGDLVGVTRLRLEGSVADASDHSYYYRPKVLLDGAQDDVRVNLRFPGDGAQAAAVQSRLLATREKDTLVLRWSAASDPARARWQVLRNDRIEIVLPTRFTQLILERGSVEARSAMEQLQVSGALVTVKGRVGHLDLSSTQCPQSCAKQARETQGKETDNCAQFMRETSALKIDAHGMQSIRVSAAIGKVELTHTEELKQLDLRLADPVSLSVDRVAPLFDAIRRGAGQRADLAACQPLTVPAPARDAAALELVTDDRPWPRTKSETGDDYD